MARLQQLLPLDEARHEHATLPCSNLPVAENKQFFGRRDILKKIDLQAPDTRKRLSSIALYGLGGIGKTQIALAYAYSKLDELDAVFWVAAQDKLSIRQSFSRIAVGIRASSQTHNPNRTRKTWSSSCFGCKETCKARPPRPARRQVLTLQSCQVATDIRQCQQP
jgi:hypothetical protein